MSEYIVSYWLNNVRHEDSYATPEDARLRAKILRERSDGMERTSLVPITIKLREQNA